MPAPARIAIHPAVAELPLKAAPIPPAWVRHGRPAASVHELTRSRDGTETCSVWSCTDGAFEWRFGVDETVHILEGAVTVTDESGRRVRLNPGDVARFAAGTTSHWEVHGFVRKLAICRHPLPLAVGLMVRAGARLQGLATRVVAGLIAKVPVGSAAMVILAVS